MEKDTQNAAHYPGVVRDDGKMLGNGESWSSFASFLKRAISMEKRDDGIMQQKS